MRSVIGIDVSKAKIDVLWLKDVAALKAKSKVFSNDYKGHAELLVWLSKQVNKPLCEMHVVMERPVFITKLWPIVYLITRSM